MKPTATEKASVFVFFVWVLVLSIPFGLWGMLGRVPGLPFGLPISATMVVVPAAVASMLVWRRHGTAGVAGLWRGIGDARRIRGGRWLAATLLCMPIATLIAYLFARLAGMALPSVPRVPMLLAPLIFAVYFLGAIPEEVGWTGYATGTLQARYGVIAAGVIIGAVWAAWHVLAWWQGQGHDLWWVAGQSLATILMRVIMGWIYAYGGRSLLAAALFHATINTSYSLYPNGGSHYNPLVLCGALTAIIGIGYLSVGRRPGPRTRPLRVRGPVARIDEYPSQP